MNKFIGASAAAALFFSAATPALAGWKLIDNGEPVKVAKSAMVVTPGEDWNRWSVRPVKKSEIWTLDGINLNEMYFVSGLKKGETLYKDANKKAQPLPKFDGSMDLTEVPEFMESSIRLALNTSAFTTTNVAPTTLGGHQAVRFEYEYSIDGSPLLRKGMAVGSIVNGELHMISYTAPATYFYDRDLAKAERIMASVRF
ncbi:hypothetical protein E3U23_02070 [Erythrobacter litoralis]|uniref:hypothetical protein n=1 Tax=Erythrobacter litoralis TaxID=39960 RepID=UPI002434B05B|nr:hypothetical protein [Erythrobacter litoralis]MDG6077984.1 hypothetical protein [Erythrobacter litoralis]